MIDLYFWTTPNGYKISILLEELALPYRVIPIHIGKGEQFAEDFLRISANGKIPAITDPDGAGGAPLSIFESRPSEISATAKPSSDLSRGPKGTAYRIPTGDNWNILFGGRAPAQER